MPELPEVETVVRGLRDIMIGRTFEQVTVTAPIKSVTISPTLGKSGLDRHLPGHTVTGISRRGKNILIALSGDITLWVHLKMTGKFRHILRTTPPDKHDLVVFELSANSNSDDADYHIRFNDFRKFGRLRLYPNDELWHQNGLAELGPEPLEISAEDFVELCHARRRMIKPTLLDQSFLAGLGNIYADESLWASRIHPLRLTDSLSRPKLVELHGHIQRLLKMAIRKAGTSVDTYAGVNGQPGTMQKYLQAYGREAEPCPRCGKAIVRQKIGSRSAHFCPRCQRPK